MFAGSCIHAAKPSGPTTFFIINRIFLSRSSKQKTISTRSEPDLQQALDYSQIFDIPFVFSSNGDGFVFSSSSLLDDKEGNITRVDLATKQKHGSQTLKNIGSDKFASRPTDGGSPSNAPHQAVRKRLTSGSSEQMEKFAAAGQRRPKTRVDQ